MRKVIQILIIILFLSSISFAGCLWKEIETQAQGMGLFVDYASLNKSKGVFYFKAKIKEDKKTSLAWVKMDCKQNKYAILDTKKYNFFTASKFDYSFDTNKLTPIKKDTLLELLKKEICASDKIEELRESLPSEEKINWAPYMKKLEAKIKKNWKPDSYDKSYKVVVFFEINKEGEVIKSKIIKSSKNEDLDAYALKTLQISSPFNPLPKEYKKQTVPVEFEFNYNIMF